MKKEYENFDHFKIENQRYLPPVNLWDKIETELEYQNQIKPLLSKLPIYEAPEITWLKIEKQITQKKGIKIFSLHFFRQVAAALLFLIIGFSLLKWLDRKETSSNASKIVAFNPGNDKSDIYIMNQVTSKYIEFCKFNPEPNPCALMNELSDLESAESELNNIIEKMGNSSNIARQLRKIELEKTRVIRNMAKRI